MQQLRFEFLIFLNLFHELLQGLTGVKKQENMRNEEDNCLVYARVCMCVFVYVCIYIDRWMDR